MKERDDEIARLTRRLREKSATPRETTTPGRNLANSTSEASWARRRATVIIHQAAPGCARAKLRADSGAPPCGGPEAAQGRRAEDKRPRADSPTCVQCWGRMRRLRAETASWPACMAGIAGMAWLLSRCQRELSARAWPAAVAAPAARGVTAPARACPSCSCMLQRALGVPRRTIA